MPLIVILSLVFLVAFLADIFGPPTTPAQARLAARIIWICSLVGLFLILTGFRTSAL